MLFFISTLSLPYLYFIPHLSLFSLVSSSFLLFFSLFSSSFIPRLSPLSFFFCEPHRRRGNIRTYSSYVECPVCAVCGRGSERDLPVGWTHSAVTSAVWKSNVEVREKLTRSFSTTCGRERKGKKRKRKEED